jgi:hypothetical protein
MAVRIYACLFRNFMHFSKHQRQQEMMQMTYCAILFPDFLAFLSRYANTARIVLMIAIISEPNAAVPI